MKKALTYLVLFLISSTAWSQNYPVQSNVNITPPYSVYLSDYASMTSNKLLVTLMLKDVNQSDIQVKLRLTIKGNGIEIRTKSDYQPQPLLLQGGAPLLISGTDLESYLNPANLDFSGISKSEFTKTGKLPEGVYQFIAEAVEYRRNVTVSNPGMTIGWLVLNDPPRWTLPMANSLLTATYPQNVFFSWMPMSTASPNSAFTTEYEFTIVELWPDSRSPGDAINSSIPLYQVTTSNTSLVYGPAEPELIPGRKYVCRLRAYDTEGRDLFKNKGYSEILVFTFGQSCKPPNIIQHQVLGPEDARVNWTSLPGTTQFVLSYAEQNADGTWSNWYHNETLMPTSNIKGLKAEHTYRYQLKAICGTLESEYSEIKQFNTPAPDTNQVECGKDISIPPLDDSPPLPMLKVGDKINVGGFEARIIEVEGSNGTFSGKCVVNVKTFGGVRILSEFENISVNESHQVTAGAINSVKGELNIIGLDEIIKEVVDVFDNTETDPNVGDPYEPGDPVTIVIDGQTVIVSGDTTFTTPEGTEVIVTLSGQPPIVNVDGEPTEVTTDKLDFDNPNTVTGNELASNVTDTSAHAIKLVTFKPVKKQLFGFDQYPEDIPQFWADYKKEKVNKKDYPVNWKSNQSFGLPDQVVMDITTDNPDSIKTRLSIESSVVGPLSYSFNPDDSTWVIQLNGQSHENEDRITAFYTQDDGSKIAVGHLDMVSYNKQDVKLVIVPVGDKYGFDKNPNYTELKDSLNAIYKGAITFWDVSITDPLEADYEENDTKGLDTDLPDMAAYTKEMRNLRSALKDRSDYNKDAYYLFLVDKSEKGDKNGIMPFRRHFGFIFMDDNGKLKDNKEKLFHTIAHELGHGAFGLEHVWQEKGTSQGATYNLMDYTSKKPDNLLRKYQWHYVHNPKSSWFGGDEEEVSDFATLGLFSNLGFGLNDIDETFTFITPTAQFIILPSNVENVTKFFGYIGTSLELERLNEFFSITPGTLKSFEIAGTIYSAYIVKENNEYKLKGYIDNTGKEYPHFNLELNENNSKAGLIFAFDNEQYKIFKLDINTLERFASGSSIVDVTKFPLSFLNPLASKDRPIDKGNDQYQMNQEVFEWAFQNYSDISDVSTLLIRNKIAELRALYPSYMKESVMENLGNWDLDKILKNAVFIEKGNTFDFYVRRKFGNPQDAGDGRTYFSLKENINPPVNKKEWFKLYFDFITNNVYESANKVGATLADLNSDKDKIKDIPLIDLTYAINYASTNDFLGLKVETIYYILSRYGKEALTIESSIGTLDFEGAFVKLINNINPLIAGKVIEKLEGKNHYDNGNLYEQLFGGADDIAFGIIGKTENRNALVQGFVKLLKNSPQLYNERLDSLLKNPDERTYELEYQNVLVRSLIEGTPGLTFYGKYFSSPESSLRKNTIKTKFQKNGKIKVIRAESVGFGNNEIGKEKEYSPFELVYFINKTNLNSLRTFDSKSNDPLLEKEDIALPAIVLAYADATTSQETLEQGIYSVIDLASFTIGVGELSVISKLSKLRQAVTIVDMSADLASLTATGVSDNKESSEIFNDISLIMGIGSMAANGVPSIKKTFDLLSNNNIKIPSLSKVGKEITSVSAEVLQDFAKSDNNYYNSRHFIEKQLPEILDQKLAQETRKTLEKLNEARKAANLNSLPINTLDDFRKRYSFFTDDQSKFLWDKPLLKDDFINTLTKVSENDFIKTLKYADNDVEKTLNLYKGVNAIEGHAALTQIDDIIDACDDVISTPKAIDYLKSYGCFVVGTKISLNNQFIPIEKVEVNDKVWTCDTQSKEKSLQTVTKTFVREVDTLVYVWLNKELIQTTAEHPFFTPGLWKPALSLKEGDEILTYQGTWIKVDSIAIKDTTCTVYNFEVEGNHNYYVGNSSILVHNTCSQTDYFKQLGFEGKSLENVQKLFNNSKFRTIYDPLGPELKEQFLKAFNEAPKTLVKFGDQPDLIKSWSVLQLNPKSFIKTDISRLEVFHKLSSDNQKLIRQFTDVDANSTLAKFLDDCDNSFINYLNDNPEFVDGFLSHKTGSSLSKAELQAKYDLLGEEIRGTRVPDAQKAHLQKWLDRSSELSSFGKYTQKGIDLSNNIFISLGTRSGKLFDNLASILKIDANVLKKYEIYKEVSFYTEGGFMKADIVLVKRGDFGLEDVIVIENKLSAGTEYTVRQKEGWKKLANGEDLIVKSPASGKDASGKVVTLNSDYSLSANKVKPYKISDHGEIYISNLFISEIPVNNWKNYTYNPQ